MQAGHASIFNMETVLRKVKVFINSSLKTEPTGKEPGQARRLTLPFWVAALIQQWTDAESDHLSPLWSPYKSSTFPLFSFAANKLMKLTFLCCIGKKSNRDFQRAVLWVVEPMHRHRYHMLFSFNRVCHKTAILTRIIHLQLLISAE